MSNKSKIRSQNTKNHNIQPVILGSQSCRKGMVLIFTLIMLAVLSALTINLSTKMNQEISLLQNSIDSLKASALAKGGINYGIAVLKNDEDLKIDGLGEDWAKQGELTFDDGIVKINIGDESGKINLNYLNARNERKTLRIEQMFELCDNIGLEYSIVPAIIDWIDADDEVTVLSSVTVGENKGAESDYYAELPLPYPCKNAPLDTVEEVMMIKGITKENYNGDTGLVNFITVFTNGKININTAGKEVLKSTIQACISSSGDKGTETVEIIDDAIITDIMEYRIGSPFYELSELKEFFPEDVVGKISGAGLFDVKSNIFTITAQTKVGKIEKKVIAIVERNQSDVKVKFWKEN